MAGRSHETGSTKASDFFDAKNENLRVFYSYIIAYKLRPFGSLSRAKPAKIGPISDDFCLVIGCRTMD